MPDFDEDALSTAISNAIGDDLRDGMLSGFVVVARVTDLDEDGSAKGRIHWLTPASTPPDIAVGILRMAEARLLHDFVSQV